MFIKLANVDDFLVDRIQVCLVHDENTRCHDHSTTECNIHCNDCMNVALIPPASILRSKYVCVITLISTALFCCRID